MDRPIHRHDRVLLDTSSQPRLPEAIHDWAGRGLPFVARRSEGAHPPGHVALAVQFPGDGKRRLAFDVPRCCIARHDPPLLLADALHAFPEALAAELHELDSDARQRRHPLSIYGSYSWQAMTGQAYASPQSDIDLLFSPASRTGLDAMLSLLDDFSARLKLDGEAIFPGGWAVSWRELLGDPDKVLARCLTDIAVLPRPEFLLLLDGAAR